MKTNLFILILSVLAILLAPAGSGYVLASDKPAGRVVAIRGEAHAFGNNGSDRLLKIKSPIFVHDTLRTGKRARLQLLFQDSSVISMGPKSEMLLADYIWNKKSGKGKMLNKAKEGVFHVIGGMLSKKSPENFKTETAIATIGIRGSSYALRLSKDLLKVVFLGGKGIDVTNAFGSVPILRPGYGTFIKKGYKPANPVKFNRKQLGNMLGQTDEKQGSKSKETTNKIQNEKSGKTSNTDSQTHKPGLASGQTAHAPKVVGENVTQTQQVKRDYETANTAEVESISPTPSEPTTAPFTGFYRNLLSNSNNTASTGDFIASSGSLSGSLKDGHISGEGITEDGKNFSFDFDIPAKSSDEEIWDFSPVSVDMDSFPIGNTELKAHTDELYYSSLREFFVLDFPEQTVVDTMDNPFLYSNTAFLGIPATEGSRPENLVSGYAGMMTGYERTFNDNYQDGGSGGIFVLVNWHNNKFIIAFEDDGGDAFLSPLSFGRISSDSPVVEKTVFLGSTGIEDSSYTEYPASYEAISHKSDIFGISGNNANTGKGMFFGSKYQGFGCSFNGNLFDIASDQTQAIGTWALSAGAFRLANDMPASTGTITLNGFVTGIGEDMNRPEDCRRFFLNNNSSEFKMTVDRDMGTIKGSLSAADFTDSSHALVNMEIGNSRESAYVFDGLFMALMGGEGVVHSCDTDKTSDIKPQGAYLVSAVGGYDYLDLADHISWGYWEAAYDDPETDAPYHIHMPGSMWVAGEKTPDSEIRDLISNDFKGQYNGKAIGIMTTDGIAGLHPMQGTAAISIDFAPSSSDPVTGTISFPDDDIALSITNGHVNSSGFNAQFANTYGSALNGGFFGSNAKSIAGNFHADMDESDKHITGIFGADESSF